MKDGFNELIKEEAEYAKTFLEDDSSDDIVDATVLPPESVDEKPTECGVVLTALERVVNSITTGASLADMTTVLEQLLIGQQSRAELLDKLVMSLDFIRAVRFTKAREKMEVFMLECFNNKSLNPTEALALLAYAEKQLATIEPKIRAGAVDVSDITKLVHKLDWAMASSQKELEKKLRKVSPQGRELIRKVGFTLSKLSRAAEPKP